jgi:hypothetical protein
VPNFKARIIERGSRWMNVALKSGDLDPNFVFPAGLSSASTLIDSFLEPFAHGPEEKQFLQQFNTSRFVPGRLSSSETGYDTGASFTSLY